MIFPLSPAHFAALAAFQLSLLLLFIDVRLAILPLALYFPGCFVASLFPRFPFFLPIVSRGKRGEQGVALTFDDGPDPEVTPRVLELLAQHRVIATFFVTGQNAERYPAILQEILAAGHTVGNHSQHHSPLLMLQGKATLRREIEAAQDALRKYGIIPLAFRPPVGVTNPHLWRILLEKGMFCLNFSCRAFDRGNRRIAGLASRLLGKVAPRDIILLHDVTPRGGDVETLLQEFDTLIRGLRARSLEIVPLPRLIGREVMRRDGARGAPNPAQLFYDELAAGYDKEQFCSAVSISRRKEVELFTARLPELFAGRERALEIGAGTGIFTLEIARQCREVLALDISANMLQILEKKARDEGIANITTVEADIETTPLHGTFSVVCAFSALEYLGDLPALCRRLAAHVEPGGIVYFITARRSFFRFFTQIGNAMRQGLWLKAHSRREMEEMLRAAGFEPVSINSHLLKSWVSGGMLLEVVARKPGRASR